MRGDPLKTRGKRTQIKKKSGKVLGASTAVVRFKNGQDWQVNSGKCWDMNKRQHEVAHPADAAASNRVVIGDRPPVDARGSLSIQEKTMIAMNQIHDPWARLATVAERYMDFLEREATANESEKGQQDERMLTPREASKILRLNAQTVMEWCRTGKLKGIKIGGTKINGKGGKWLIPREEIDAYLRRDRLINGPRNGGAK